MSLYSVFCLTKTPATSRSTDGKGRPRQKTEGDEHEETAFERESRLLNAAIGEQPRRVYSPPAAKLSLDSRASPWSAERARAAKAQEMLELEAAHDGHETPLQRE